MDAASAMKEVVEHRSGVMDRLAQSIKTETTKLQELRTSTRAEQKELADFK